MASISVSDSNAGEGWLEPSKKIFDSAPGDEIIVLGYESCQVVVIGKTFYLKRTELRSHIGKPMRNVFHDQLSDDSMWEAPVPR